jgi:HK97 family phage portal protein
MAGIGTALARVLLAPFTRSDPPQEGQPRDGPWPVVNPDGWLPNEWGQFLNYWQMGYDPIPFGGSAIVQACINAYAQTMAMCPGDHWRLGSDGGRERVTTSALSRVLRRPNDYQSRSDFILNLARDLYGEGNTYALAQRNSRAEVIAFHAFDPKRSKPVVAEDGSVFYSLAGNNVIEKAMALGGSTWLSTGQGLLAPARDVLHIKLDATPGEPLLGIPPSRHAEAAISASSLISQQLITFFGNMSRPSGVLSTDLNLTGDQVNELRRRWNDQSRGLNSGGVPILTNGLKFAAMSVSAKDSELASMIKMTQDEIFMVYGVPPAILGMTDKAAFASTEALMQFWLSRGLGFALNHIETGFDHFFGLRGWPNEYVELDTQALLRVQFKDRIEALAKGTISGIFSPDEARNSEDLPKTPYGEEPRVQQQVVPLSAWANPQPATVAPAPGAPPAPANDPNAPPAADTPPADASFESEQRDSTTDEEIEAYFDEQAA